MKHINEKKTPKKIRENFVGDKDKKTEVLKYVICIWIRSHSITSQICGSQKGLEPKIRLYCTKSPPNFESTSDETLEALCEHLEALIDDNPKLLEADVTLASGVLTLLLPHPFGTYVINKQSPNQQIWLSSPQSGPMRYKSGNCSILAHKTQP